jgi:hypothetical protein
MGENSSRVQLVILRVPIINNLYSVKGKKSYEEAINKK